MSRYCGDKDATVILEAAAHWRDAALIGGASVFGAEAIWSDQALGRLYSAYVQNLDEDDGDFLAKLRKQLGAESPVTHQLAAEMLWLLYLCPSSVTPRRKRTTIETVWSWSSKPFPNESVWLQDAALQGIGSAGPGFNLNLWRELVFAINLMQGFRSLPPETQQRHLADPWSFDEWIRAIPEWDSRQFRHMILYLLFPEQFERIFGQRDRKAIIRHYQPLPAREVNRMDPVQMDRSLAQIRSRLESERGTNQLDFYHLPLVEEWGETGLASATEGLTHEHVLSALRSIDTQGASGAESTGFDLVHDGKRYPPKLVLSLAVKALSGEQLDRTSFSGGEASNRILRRLGFQIDRKVVSNMTDLSTVLQRFLDQARQGTSLGVQDYPAEYRGLALKVSFGKGNFARVPWIAFLGPGQSVSQGIYPLLLFFKEAGHLLLCYGTSEENAPPVEWHTLSGAPTVEDWFLKKLSRLPERYGGCSVRQAVDTSQAIPVDELSKNLDNMIDQYKAELSARAIPGAEQLSVWCDLREAVTAFSVALRESNVQFGDGHDSLVRAFLISLVTKPLVILTGLSGSGKTQIAVRLGEWLGNGRLYVAAVRPDWTGAEALFGYEDGLRPLVNGRPQWSVPDTLAFMLAAANDPQHPYLLLLDEMNLAHVERYFADVLSGMESGQPCLPNLSREEDGCWRARPSASGRIPLPRNLWIVGTVNVDETTYMFSPKVLDRANTFEFRVASSDLTTLARRPSPCTPGDPALVRGLLALSRDDARHLVKPADFAEDLAIHLRQLHHLLSRYNFEFGHRTFHEALRFGSLLSEAGLDQLDEVLDRILMQKILPRLHGARRKLELPLLALLAFTRAPNNPVAPNDKLAAQEADQAENPLVRLPDSHAKLTRMLTALRANQFASFTE